MRVTVKPELLTWASKRAGLNADLLLHYFPKYEEWLQGVTQPTLKQLESFAQKTHVSLGMFFLPEPPQEQLPIPDFRIMDALSVAELSSNLLETIYQCQQKQDWYRDYQQTQGFDTIGFVGSATLSDEVTETAGKICQTIQFEPAQRQQARTWTEALRLFIEQIESQAILVMVNGVVGSNNRRKLDPQEFRGFALVDKIAPLVFVNGSDTKAAQMFTLAHELAHIWLGESGISNIQSSDTHTESQVERWCNQVAAELLVPLADISQHYKADHPLTTEMDKLSKQYKVSTLVILRRIYDLGAISHETLWQTYSEELERLKKLTRQSDSSGDFYRTLGVRVSKRFTNALVNHTLEGQTLFRDAFKLLGIKKVATFYEISRQFGEHS